MSFDLLAPHYRWMERVLAGSKLQRCRMAWLGEIQRPANILLLGEGHGRFLPEVLRRFAGARVTCLDASSAMLAQAQRNLQKEGIDPRSVHWVHSDIMAWTPPAANYDLVATHFFLDCFTPDQLRLLIDKVSGATTHHAQWLLADFRLPTDGFRRFRAQVILWLMYRFFQSATRLPARSLASPTPELSARGFSLEREMVFEWGLLHSQLWSRI